MAWLVEYPIWVVPHFLRKQLAALILMIKLVLPPINIINKNSHF
jgi:hypothetical protein